MRWFSSRALLTALILALVLGLAFFPVRAARSAASSSSESSPRRVRSPDLLRSTHRLSALSRAAAAIRALPSGVFDPSFFSRRDCKLFAPGKKFNHAEQHYIVEI